MSHLRTLLSTDSAKAWIGAIVAAALTGLSLAQDGTFDRMDALSTAGAFLAALGAVYGIPNTGTVPDAVHIAETRAKFRQGLRIGYGMPKNADMDKVITEHAADD